MDMFEHDELLKNHDILNIADNLKIDEIVKRFKLSEYTWTCLNMMKFQKVIAFLRMTKL